MWCVYILLLYFLLEVTYGLFQSEGGKRWYCFPVKTADLLKSESANYMTSN